MLTPLWSSPILQNVQFDTLNIHSDTVHSSNVFCVLVSSLEGISSSMLKMCYYYTVYKNTVYSRHDDDVYTCTDVVYSVSYKV